MLTAPLILVVEDDPAMRDLLDRSLAKRGYRVQCCRDGAEALEQLRASTHGTAPALIISDVQMPGANGMDILHWLNTSSLSVPVILITSFGDRRTHRRARELGAFSVLDKPFALPDLHHEVENALRGAA